MLSMQVKLTRSRLFRRFAIGSGIVVLYLLGVGPSELLWRRGLVSESALRVVYFPLLAVGGTPLEKPLDWYCELWTDKSMPCCPDEIDHVHR